MNGPASGSAGRLLWPSLSKDVFLFMADNWGTESDLDWDSLGLIRSPLRAAGLKNIRL
jgi:hypothetical protein